MRACKFAAVDFLKSQIQVYFLIGFSVIAFIYMRKSLSPLNGIWYLCFGGVVMGVQPFIQEQSEEAGFISMLPGTKKSRVAGRYLYGLGLQLLAVILGLLTFFVYTLVYQEGFFAAPEAAMTGFGVGVIFCSLQYLLFFAAGKFKVRQFSTLIMMIPSFLMFFGVPAAADWLVSEKYISADWFLEHRLLLCIMLMAAGLVVWAGCMLVSAFIVRRRDEV